MGVRANADIPRDAIQARAFGAEGIGLCRTEHMFFAEDRLPHMRAMILADNEKDRRAALRKLLPMQRADFVGCSAPWTDCRSPSAPSIRRCTSSCRAREELMVEIAELEAHQAEIAQAERAAHAAEPRGAAARIQSHARPCAAAAWASPIRRSPRCRRAPSSRRRVKVAKEGVKVKPEVMIPLTGGLKEMANQAAIVRRVAEEVFAEKEQKVEYLVGTMIELPRAALVADEIAKEAEFFSFGTNDLTQTTFGFSRDDINKILPTYLAEGILKQDPFAVLDREGVGQLMKIGSGERPQHPADHQDRHLRRTWRRTVVGRVLRAARIQLRLLLALPRADGAPGGRAGGRQRRTEDRRRKDEIILLTIT